MQNFWLVGDRIADERYRCVHTAKSTGKRCRCVSIRGGTECKAHGGLRWDRWVAAGRRELEEAVQEHLRSRGYDV